jgi:hypothetical protein
VGKRANAPDYWMPLVPLLGQRLSDAEVDAEIARWHGGLLSRRLPHTFPQLSGQVSSTRSGGVLVGVGLHDGKLCEGLLVVGTARTGAPWLLLYSGRARDEGPDEMIVRRSWPLRRGQVAAVAAPGAVLPAEQVTVAIEQHRESYRAFLRRDER